MSNPKAWVRLHGNKVRLGEFRNEHHALHFELADTERAIAIGCAGAKPFSLARTDKSGGGVAWSEIAGELDQYSLWEFLENRGWSQGAIELYCLVFHMEPFLN